ncbi:hypothetical protein GC174_10230 [bacterium]|nr:hypothetical protein [bacterium]
MKNLMPISIKAKDENTYIGTFTREDSRVQYIFSFGDNPRGIEDYDDRYYLDTNNDPGAEWFGRCLITFDIARQNGKCVTQSFPDSLIPVSLIVGNTSNDKALYIVEFEGREEPNRSFEFVVSGDNIEQEARWEYGKCVSWLENGRYIFKENDPSINPLLKAILRLHQAIHCESQYTR